MRKLLIILGLLCATNAFAKSDLDAVLGVGIGKNVFGSAPFERYGMIGVRYGNAWKVQLNSGYYVANALGEKSSFIGSLQGGLEVVGSGGAFAQFFFGPALISQDDAKLAGTFQFHLTGGVGVRNNDGYGIGISWQHFSNAGIQQPNLGRDLLTLQVTIPLLAIK